MNYFFVAPMLINTAGPRDSVLAFSVGDDGIARLLGVYKSHDEAIAAAKSVKDSSP